jgi:hypothetical protein
VFPAVGKRSNLTLRGFQVIAFSRVAWSEVDEFVGPFSCDGSFGADSIASQRGSSSDHGWLHVTAILNRTFDAEFWHVSSTLRDIVAT